MTRQALPFAIALALVGGCRHENPAAPAPASAQVTASVASVTTAVAKLDQLDTRTPVPLLPMMANHQKQNMRDHLVAVQEIVLALAADDYAAVERAAGRMGFSEQMGQMCTHMGAGAPGFTEKALVFHHTAYAAHRDRQIREDRDRLIRLIVTA